MSHHAFKHGLSNTTEYHTWNDMRRRCFNPKHPHFKYYGGRGITACEEWANDFLAFLADMGKRPEGMELDREDNDGNYEPSNCRWTTREKQNENRRATIRLTFQGRTQLLKDWAKEIGLSYDCIKQRNKRGLSVEQILAK